MIARLVLALGLSQLEAGSLKLEASPTSFQPPASRWAFQADDVCHVELMSLEVHNGGLAQALTADGVLVNRSPLELGDVAVEVTVIAANNVRLKTMPAQRWTKLPPRKGAAISIQDVALVQPPDFSTRVKVTYRIEGVERIFEWDGLKLRFGKPYADPEGGTRLGLAGLLTVAGSHQKQGKNLVYTGDTIFLRLRVEGLDEKARPEGTVEVTLSLDGKKQGTVKHSIGAAHWKLDAAKLPSNDADPKIVCYDAAARELIIGLCRIDDERKAAKLGLDAKFTWKKQVWTWPALDPPFVDAPRPPDKK